MNNILRKATRNDARFLFELRNEISVRQASFNTNEISFEAHTTWLAKKLSDPRTVLYIAETDGRPTAQIRFDLEEHSVAEISIAVIPSQRGHGFGTRLISKATTYFFRENPQITRVHAYIKKNNEASLQSFMKAGYGVPHEVRSGRQRVMRMTIRSCQPFSIAEKVIGPGHPCFVVAEISGNHHQKYDEAVALIYAAKEAGADAVKLQTYTPDTITLNSDKKWFQVGGQDNPKGWKGKTLYELYKESYTPWEWQPKLKKLADKLGIILFSSPFDETAVDFLEAVGVCCYKIASYEATDFLLLRKVARTGKPILMSVGYASLQEIKFALKTLREHGSTNIALLHCVTGYSKDPEATDIHLSNIKDLQRRFNVPCGFSDNNAGIEIPLMAVMSGACMLEKHLTLDRRKGGPDARFSLEPSELKKLIQKIRMMESGIETVMVNEQAVGTPRYGAMNRIEAYNKRWRRSLFAGKDIKKGELFTPRNVRDVRPSFGLETKYYDSIIGKKATRDVDFATPLSREMISR